MAQDKNKQELTRVLGKSWFKECHRDLVVGPLLFNIYLNDLFYLAESTNMCNYGDDTTFYACDKDLNSLTNRLEHDSYLAIKWF